MRSTGVAGAALALLSLACAGEPAQMESMEAEADASAADMARTGAPDAGLPPAMDSAAVAEDAAPVTSDVRTCGAPPYQLVRLSARNPMAPSNQRDLAGVRITLEHCPGVEVLTDIDGKALVNVTQNAETWIRFDAPDFVPWLCGRMHVSSALGKQGLIANMFSDALAPSFLPSYKPTKPFVYVQVQAGRSDAPVACRTRDNVTITVKDHPEAIVLYRQVGSNAPYVKGAWTTTEGGVIVSGLPSSLGAIEITATKKGCTYVAAYGDANSAVLVPITKVPLQDGALSYTTFNPVR